MNAKEIRDLFNSHNVDLGQKDVWEVQGTPVIKHSALERLAAALKIRFDPPTVLRAERDEAVILTVGRLGEVAEWSIGEALVGANYRVSGKMAAYVYAMAEKRSKDRVILKLANLHGAYSEEEADDFRNSAPVSHTQGAEAGGDEAPRNSPPANSNDRTIANTLSETLRKAKTVPDLAQWFTDNSANIEALPESLKDEVRGAYAEHLHSLKRAA